MTAAATVPTGTSNPDPVDGSVDRTDWVAAVPFLVAHLVPLAAFFVVVTWQDWVLCAVLYLSRMFFITAGYHRYFSHRSYRMSRAAQFLMAFGGTTALQKGPLWWASHHRLHHRYTDLDEDVHSPRDGFWWSHVGWILSTKYKDTDLSAIKDFAACPELRLVERTSWIGPWLLAIACFLVGGWGGLVIGFFLSTVLLWHGTFLVNSMAHLMGRRRFATPDTSRNSMIIAVITGGEGWHNNHHYLPASARQGFTWWEIDPTWYALRGLAALRIVHDLKDPPARLLDQARVRDGAFDIGMFRSYWERAAKVTGERIADLSARPMAPSAESHDVIATDANGPTGTTVPHDPTVPTATTVPTSAQDRPPEAGEPLSHLAGLISRVLESADQLAASTRRTRKPPKVTSHEQGSPDRSTE
jgi:stearoyl-CoA desaturase (delta-9 desaturase)